MDESYRIQISSNLVNKLASDSAQQKKKSKKIKPKKPKVLPKHQIEPKPIPDTWPVQSPVYLPVPPPPPPPSIAIAELDAIRSVLQESERVMKKLEQKEANMTLELTQRAKELREKEFKLPYQKSMPCEIEREACKNCYKENSKQPLKCAQVVRSFENCARKARQLQQQVNSKV